MQKTTQRHIFRTLAFRLCALTLFIGGVGLEGRAADLPERPFVHPLFSDNVVLQRGEAVPVWGWAKPGEVVTVTLDSHVAKARAGADGKWVVRLPRLLHGGPLEMAIQGERTVTLTNVLVGDVWLCSGQSNMEMGIGEVNRASEEIKQADYERIRLFSVPKHIATEPQALLESRWKLCNPETIVQGDYAGFTAAGFFFGRDLHLELGVPIGLIDSTWGGTVAEAWTSAEALAAMDDFRPAVEQVQLLSEQLNSGRYEIETARRKWFAEADAGSVEAAWSRPHLNDADWASATLPGAWEAAGLGQFDGIVWYRKVIDLPAGWTGGDVTLHLGPIDDQDTTWVNGTMVGTTDVWNRARDYRLPAGTLKEGRNVIAVRVLDTGGGGGFVGQAGQMGLESGAGGASKTFDLGGSWRYRRSAGLSEAGPMPQRLDNNPNVVTVLYNGMIAPLLPYSIKGALWYQGESNAGRAAQYQELLPTLIRDWRERFGVGEFPFLIVQLANFMAVDPEPVESAWAELREAQWFTARTLPNTGLAVAIDIGEADDIHPRNKQEVGRRLALAARSIAYGQELPFSGPSCRSSRREGNRIRLRFDHVDGGLVAKGGGELRGFAVAGADGKFVWAEAAIDGETVVVSSPRVAEPVTVRYAWANNPVCNLHNGAGLPAVPFRTDAGD